MPFYTQGLYTHLCTTYPQKALERVLFSMIDIFCHYENLYSGLHGGEVSNTYVRGYGQSVQAEALRCTSKSARKGAFALSE